jgi:hypothetical protein
MTYQFRFSFYKALKEYTETYDVTYYNMLVKVNITYKDDLLHYITMFNSVYQ